MQSYDYAFFANFAKNNYLTKAQISSITNFYSPT